MASEKDYEIFYEWEGLFNIIKEKLPVHAVAVRYLRFSPNDLREPGNMGGLLDDTGVSELTASALQEEGSSDYNFGMGVVGTDAPMVELQSFDRSPGNAPQSVVEKSSKMAALNMDMDPTNSTVVVNRNGPIFEHGLHPSVLSLLEDTAGAGAQRRQESASDELIKAAPYIVQDMAACVAEIVATLYLADVHVKGKKGWNHIRLSQYTEASMPFGIMCLTIQ